MMNFVVALLLMVIALQARAANLNMPFVSVDGGTMTLSQWSDRPILLSNTGRGCCARVALSGLSGSVAATFQGVPGLSARLWAKP